LNGMEALFVRRAMAEGGRTERSARGPHRRADGNRTLSREAARDARQAKQAGAEAGGYLIGGGFFPGRHPPRGCRLSPRVKRFRDIVVGKADAGRGTIRTVAKWSEGLDWSSGCGS